MPRPTTKPTKTRMLATNVPEDVAKDFEAIATAHDRKVAAELRRLVRQHIAENKRAAA
jgi:plasmid stability protein